MKIASSIDSIPRRALCIVELRLRAMSSAVAAGGVDVCRRDDHISSCRPRNGRIEVHFQLHRGKITTAIFQCVYSSSLVLSCRWRGIANFSFPFGSNQTSDSEFLGKASEEACYLARVGPSVFPLDWRTPSEESKVSMYVCIANSS